VNVQFEFIMVKYRSSWPSDLHARCRKIA